MPKCFSGWSPTLGGMERKAPASGPLLPLERGAPAFGLDALLLEHLDQFLPVSADRGRCVDPDLPRYGNAASLRLGDPLREGLDQVPSVLPLRGVGILFQAVHALPELVQLREGRLDVENHHPAVPLSEFNSPTSGLLYRICIGKDSADCRCGSHPPDWWIVGFRHSLGQGAEPRFASPGGAATAHFVRASIIG